MPFEKSQPVLNVYFINTINTTTPGYGVSLNQGYLSLIDNSNKSAFGNVGGGALRVSHITPIEGIGNYWTGSSAGTAGVVTVIEPVLVVNTTYSFILNQYIPATALLPGKTVTYNVSYPVGAVVPAAGTVVAAMAAIINANAGFQVTTALSGTNNTILTITASAGYYLLYPNATGLGVGNLTSVTQTTTGVLSQGYSYDMYDYNEYGQPFASFYGYVSTNNYSQFACQYTDLVTGGTNIIYVFVNSADPNYGNTTSKFVYQFVVNALALGGAITSTNSISVLSLVQAANQLEATALE